MQETLSAQIAALPTLNKAQLLAVWAENFNNDPPPNLRKELMVPVLANRLPNALAILHVAEVIHAFWMVPWFSIHEAIVRFQLVIGRKDWVDVGATSIEKLDPDLEADGRYRHRDIS